MKIQSKSITKNDILKTIEFDKYYLINAMKEMDIPSVQLPPSLTKEELESALLRKDILRWLYVNNELVGYYWFEKKQDCIYIAGFAIKKNFQGIGLSKYVLKLAEKTAIKNQVNFCRLAAIPLNGRAVNAYLKHGYRITSCIEGFFGENYPDSFRFIMELNVHNKDNANDLTHAHEVLCSDYERLKNLTDQGYIGFHLIQAKNNSNFKNTICFKTNANNQQDKNEPR